MTATRLFTHKRHLQWMFVGAITLWSAFPPLNWAPAAWLGLAIWITVTLHPAVEDRRDYLEWYAAGFVHWLFVIHWLRLPHWSAWFGWVLLSMYLAAYVPAFVWLLRTAVASRVPALLAAPVIWAGLEWLRSHLFSGLSISLLSHTQVRLPALIQIADIAVAYGVSFLVVLVATCLALFVLKWLPKRGANPAGSKRPAGLLGKSWPILVGFIVLVAAHGYGELRIGQIEEPNSRQGASPIRVALIQGSIDTTFSEEDTSDAIFAEYAKLTGSALIQSADSDQRPLALIVWPESMFSYPWIEVAQPVQLPNDEGTDVTTYRAQVDAWRKATIERARQYVRQIGIPMLVGAGKLQFGPHPVQRFNSALYFDSNGNLIDSYDKMRPILFGEYLPLGNVIPGLYHLSPMGSGLDRGTVPLVVQCQGVRFSPSICFENTIPHLMRQQFRQLRNHGESPDVLVTLTNDGWFWGSSLLDTHLACGIFRAVELRRPTLIAANTGFSAWIDATGRVVTARPTA